MRPHWHVLECLVVAVVLANHARHERARLDANGLINDATFRRIVFDFDVADEWKVFTERVAMGIVRSWWDDANAECRGLGRVC